jgi:hypothetical protein
MHKDYFEPTLNRFRYILIWIWRIWCMTYKYVISGGWRSYFLCSFIEIPKAYCNIPIHHHKLFINPVTWERTTLTLIQCRGGSKGGSTGARLGLHLFCFYWFLAICIYCVPLTLMIKHYTVSNYLRQYKSHVIVAIVWYAQPMIIYIAGPDPVFQARVAHLTQ